jgi:hypothetical protein
VNASSLGGAVSLVRSPGLSNDMQRNVRDQVEQENTDLEDCHSRIMQSVKLLMRQMKPFAVPPLYLIMCQQEEQPPYEQDAIVEDGTPE